MASTRRLAAILAADVAGYSRLMGADEEGTHERLKAHLGELVNPKIAEHRGRIVKNTGDGFLAEFASVVDVVRCAVEMQRGMSERNAGTPPEKRIEFRVGINLGDVIAEGEDIFGDGVNVAARLEALAEPGGICVSRVVRDQVRDRLDYAFEDLGEQQVKNIARPVRVYQVHATGGATKDPSAETSPLLPLPDKPSIAVLPFANMSRDPEQEYFTDGMAEEITTAIARLPWLFVIARNSAFTYKGRAVDVRQVARELGVRYVLEGSVRRAANRVRITSQLIDTATGAHIWADRFDGSLDDIFELQEQVASSVVGAIEPKLRQSEIERAIRKPTESLDAYDLYLRALSEFHKTTPDGHHRAVVLLRHVLDADPSYAPAAALIGWCHASQRRNGWVSFSASELADTIGFAERAIALGKDDPEALWMGGFVIAAFAGRHSPALGAIRRALTLNPNNAHAWFAGGVVHCYLNEPEPAIEAIQRAIRLSPLDPMSHYFKGFLALAYMVAGCFKDGMEYADQAVAEQPYWVPGVRLKAAMCGHLGLIEEAHKWVNRHLELDPGMTIARFGEIAKSNAAPEMVAIYLEGLRKAGLPEE